MKDDDASFVFGFLAGLLACICVVGVISAIKKETQEVPSYGRFCVEYQAHKWGSPEWNECVANLTHTKKFTGAK